MAGAGVPAVSFYKLKWWGQKSTVYGNDGTGTDKTSDDPTTDLHGDVKPPENTQVQRSDEWRVKIFGKLDSAPSFNAEENEGRLQRVLEVATNNLLSEKVSPRLAAISLAASRDRLTALLPSR